MSLIFPLLFTGADACTYCIIRFTYFVQILAFDANLNGILFEINRAGLKWGPAGPICHFRSHVDKIIQYFTDMEFRAVMDSNLLVFGCFEFCSSLAVNGGIEETLEFKYNLIYDKFVMTYFYRVNLSQYYTYNYKHKQNYIPRSRLNTNSHRPPRSTLRPALYILTFGYANRGFERFGESRFYRKRNTSP